MSQGPLILSFEIELPVKSNHAKVVPSLNLNTVLSLLFDSKGDQKLW